MNANKAKSFKDKLTALSETQGEDTISDSSPLGAPDTVDRPPLFISENPASGVVRSGSMTRLSQVTEYVAPPKSARGGYASLPKIVEKSVVFCTKCGANNSEKSFMCSRCGVSLQSSTKPHYVVVGGSIGGLIPYRNSAALIGYYLGVFSLIPVLGIPLGIVAVILGSKGLKFAKLNPDAKGVGHAWTAIILGGLSAVGYTLLIAALISGVAVI